MTTKKAFQAFPACVALLLGAGCNRAAPATVPPGVAQVRVLSGADATDTPLELEIAAGSEVNVALGFADRPQSLDTGEKDLLGRIAVAPGKPVRVRVDPRVWSGGQVFRELLAPMATSEELPALEKAAQPLQERKVLVLTASLSGPSGSSTTKLPRAYPVEGVPVVSRSGWNGTQQVGTNRSVLLQSWVFSPGPMPGVHLDGNRPYILSGDTSGEKLPLNKHARPIWLLWLRITGG